MDSCTENIVTRFPDTNSNVPYVNERFDATWHPEHDWGWQQNRAIVGHNLKIAWNLTRVANYYLATGNSKDAEKALNLATTLADKMLEFGLDPVRGGCFDAVERDPKNGMAFEFTWSSTKDFWQQEQGILAYLILYGQTGKQEYLDAARETIAFWNIFFLDRDNRGIFFRVTDIGNPVIEGDYVNKATHAIAGYHSFELNYLAHIYTRSSIGIKPSGDEDFCLYFHLRSNNKQRSINVLPDYFPPGRLKITGITANGIPRAVENPQNFQISISESDLVSDSGCDLVVEFGASNDSNEENSSMSYKPLLGKKIAILMESEYIPHEIKCYQDRFTELGATVHFMSRLWGQQSSTFINDIDPLSTDRNIYEFIVDIDFDKVDVNDYAAVLMVANYCSVRLRYFQPPEGSPVKPEQVKTAPAVQFFARAMANKSIVKGALCHGLWILTPMPELLKGRKVICHEVVLADIVNAGGIYESSPTKVVVDEDLVTGYSAKEVELYVDAIAERISGGMPKKKDCYKPLF
ncbi:DJ-1/PfpI family protein [Nostoc foliaceum]|uniref:DJ-1/PfpI family protein n=1 Tax=Nostoc foliaceum TaxID=2692914 RepID=UPI0018EF9C38|nr:DJ-1/PfpI family protein [Nostoc foliaceum]